MYKELKEKYKKREERRNKHFEELAKVLSENDPIMELLRKNEEELKEAQEERLRMLKLIEEHKKKLESFKVIEGGDEA